MKLSSLNQIIKDTEPCHEKDRSGFISENLLRRAKLDKQLSFYQELEGSGVKGVNAVKAGSLVINRKPASIQVVEGPELDAKFS